MKEKPMLFNTEMVQAIMEGRKTQTRRIIKRTKSNDEPCGYGFWKEWSARDTCWYVKDYSHSAIWFTLKEYISRFSRYHVGDIIYVRETWQESECFDNNIKNKYVYRANKSDAEFAEEYHLKGRPSIHMPKVAARIFLRVIDVRIERVQDITEEGAKSEGIRSFTKDNSVWKYSHKEEFNWQNAPRTAKEAFGDLWDSCSKEGYKWDENPFVLVVKFERIKG